MSPAAIARAQNFAATNSLSALESNFLAAQNEGSDDWGGATMDSSLDFDLLAEYLLEDGGGMFDLGPEASSPPLEPNEQQQAAGLVTPHTIDPIFADPLADALEQLRNGNGGNNLPNSGDLANELAQVQNMIAQQQQQMNQAPQQPQAVVKAAAPLPAYMQLPKPAQATIPNQNGATRPIAANGLSIPPAKRSRVENGAPTNGSTIPSFSGNSTAVPQMPQTTSPYPRSYSATPSAAAKAAADRAKGQAQIDRRRERNRILARRTRLRKKFFFESLQKDVADLQQENAALKSIIRSRLKPEDAHAILSTCNANEKLPSIIHDPDMMGGDEGMDGGDKAVKQLDKEDFNLIQSIQNSQQCFIITDPSLHDNPIVYASNDFLDLTGYSQEEVLGRNCRFLQGTETSQEKVAVIRKAVSVGEDCNVTLVNYTSSGKPFWNSLFIAALRDAENNIVNFIGVIVKVAGPEPGDAEYGKVLSS